MTLVVAIFDFPLLICGAVDTAMSLHVVDDVDIVDVITQLVDTAAAHDVLSPQLSFLN